MSRRTYGDRTLTSLEKLNALKIEAVNQLIEANQNMSRLTDLVKSLTILVAAIEKRVDILEGAGLPPTREE
jgi:hypothetical protein